ncbi:hypothetical protein JXB12_04785 [candidate division KSB1 bacterium]|nr:hypothetical protein [candidate division KSB1 bacterium]
MNIAILGTFVLDEIHHIDGSVTKSFGGLSYAIAIISQLVSSVDQIFPISKVGYDAQNDFLSFLSTFPNVRTNGLITEPHSRHTCVNLFYTDAENRYEILNNPFSPMSIRDITPFLSCNALLLNYITGFELDLNTHHQICQQSSSLVYMDFHSLTLGREDDGRRYHRYLNDWESWLEHVDILQLNEHEAALLNRSSDYHHFAEHVLNSGVQILNITLGAKGSMLFFKEQKSIVTNHVDSCFNELAVDVTGCGDAFACGFIIDYLRNKDPLHAARTANYVAGYNSTLSGLKDIHNLAALTSHEDIWKKY